MPLFSFWIKMDAMFGRGERAGQDGKARLLRNSHGVQGSSFYFGLSSFLLQLDYLDSHSIEMKRPSQWFGRNFSKYIVFWLNQKRFLGKDSMGILW
jgi:hypothetical protein